jgi:hypothetical protein
MANSTAIDPPPLVRGVVTLQHPDDADFVDLWRLWMSKRGNRPMPSRRDFEPWEFKPLLPDIFLVDVTGKTFEECFELSAAALLTALYDSVVEGRAPVFRAGAAYWWTEKQYDMYESCHLPLSPDGRSVNMVLAAIRFHKPH